MERLIAPIALAGGIVLAAWYWSRAEAAMRDESDNAPGLVDGFNVLVDEFSEGGVSDDQAARNVRAFLDAIAWAEGTARQAGDGYRTLYGYGTFDRFDDHPALLGWSGVALTDEQCRGAGFGPGCVSTAAGRYQITKPTWLRVRGKLGLVDFSPGSQDAAAVELIREKGALGDVQAGGIDAAADKVRRVWASFPAAGYAGQGSRSLDGLRTVFAEAGGYIA